MISTCHVSSSKRAAEANAPGCKSAFNREFVRLEAAALVGYTFFFIYLSLVPFDLDLTTPAATSGRAFFGLQAAQVSLPDIAANVAFFLPFGAVWFHFQRQQGRSRAAAGLWTTMVCTSLSLAIEQAQRWFPSRVGSWVDVSSNLVGALLGVGILWFGENALRRASGRIRAAAASRWWMVVGRVFVVIVLLVQLRPFDPVIDPHHAAATAMRRANPRPWARWQALETTVLAHHAGDHGLASMELARARWEYGLDRTVDIALYAAVAVLLVVGRSRKGRCTVGDYLRAGTVIMGLSAVITVTRIFLISHGLDTAQMACGVVGWPIGCLIGREWARRAVSSSEAGVGTRIGPPPLRWQRGLAFAAIAIVVLYEIVPFDFRATRPAELVEGANLSVIPFAAHWECRLNQAFHDLSGDGLRYAVVSMGLAILLRLGPRRRETRVCVCLATAICAVLESLHLWMPSRFTDATTIVMAAAGSYAGIASLQWARALYERLTAVIAADPLTAQLVEGATYQPLPVPAVPPRAGTSLRDPVQAVPPR